MATNHPELIKAASQVAAIDRRVARVRSEGKDFEKAIVQAMVKDGSEGVNDVLENLPGLRKSIGDCHASLKPILHLYAALSKDKTFLEAEGHEIAPHVHHLGKLRLELEALEKKLTDLEKEVQAVGFLDKSELRKFERFLETFRRDAENFKRQVAKASASADALAEVGLKAFNDRDDKGAMAARDAIQKIAKDLGAAKDKLNSSLGQLPDNMSANDMAAFRKVEAIFMESCARIDATFAQYIKDMNDRGRLDRIDVRKAAALLKISDKKDIDVLDKALNSMRGDVPKALEPLARKHRTNAKAMADSLKRARLWQTA